MSITNSVFFLLKNVPSGLKRRRELGTVTLPWGLGIPPDHTHSRRLNYANVYIVRAAEVAL